MNPVQDLAVVQAMQNMYPNPEPIPEIREPREPWQDELDQMNWQDAMMDRLENQGYDVERNPFKHDVISYITKLTKLK